MNGHNNMRMEVLHSDIDLNIYACVLGVVVSVRLRGRVHERRESQKKGTE
jgi:hypothetical protein